MTISSVRFDARNAKHTTYVRSVRSSRSRLACAVTLSRCTHPVRASRLTELRKPACEGLSNRAHRVSTAATYPQLQQTSIVRIKTEVPDTLVDEESSEAARTHQPCHCESAQMPTYMSPAKVPRSIAPSVLSNGGSGGGSGLRVEAIMVAGPFRDYFFS